jgi:hypothetical protein
MLGKGATVSAILPPRSFAAASPSEDLTHEVLDNLSHAFCESLSRNGKPLVSTHNLQWLLDAHPNDPQQCVRAAAAFMRPRQRNEFVLNQISLYSFLKRAGVGENLYHFTSNNVDTIAKLLALAKAEGNVIKLAGSMMRDHNLTEDQSLDLAEIITKTATERGALAKFPLHRRARVIQTFIAFYSVPHPELEPKDSTDSDPTAAAEKSTKESTEPSKTANESKSTEPSKEANATKQKPLRFFENS